MAVMTSRVDWRSAAGVAAAARGRQQLELLGERLALAATGGRDAHIQRHRGRGKLLVRERIDFVLDDASAFLELSPLAAWGQYGNEVPAAVPSVIQSSLSCTPSLPRNSALPLPRAVITVG